MTLISIAVPSNISRRPPGWVLLPIVFSPPLIVAFILLGGFEPGRYDRPGVGRSRNMERDWIFAGILFLASSLVNIPFSIYGTFVIEERYGFNRTTVKTFVFDLFKGWGLAGLIGGIVFAAIIWFFSVAGSSAWLLCWGAVTAFQLFLLFIAPVTIMPLFNKFTPPGKKGVVEN